MMITIEKLDQFGADTREAVERCGGMEALYLKLVQMLPSEADFDRLSAALQANDLDAAFAAAHSLKGVTGNLSLTPLYKRVSEITELLRSRTDMDYAPLLAEILQLRENLAALCSE